MKKTQQLIACALLFVLAGLTSLRAVEEGRKDGKAIVRTVHGTVLYLDNNNQWQKVKPNMKFGPGVTIKTGTDGTVDINVNGTSSSLRLTNSTTVQIPAMSYVGDSREGDTTTMLNLETGSILGNVKKISANSRYEIMTPHGVAGIRGTDYHVEAIPTPDGVFHVKFDSITGVLTVSVKVDGETILKTLTSGTSWEVGKAPEQMKPEVLQSFQSQVNGMVSSIETIISAGVPMHGLGNSGNGGNLNGPNPTSPFTGGPPQGPPSTPTPEPAPPQGAPAS